MPQPLQDTRLVVVAHGRKARADSSDEAPAVATLVAGDVFDVLAASDDNDWFQVSLADAPAWVRARHVQLLPTPRDAPFPWFVVAEQEMALQVAELAGPAANPEIAKYLHSTSLHHDDASSDETPWCSVFVNWCVERSGRRGTGSASARSWLRWGAALNRPIVGCVVVFSRPEAGRHAGHVAFYVSYDDAQGTINVLGGNQGDRVCVMAYPAARILGFRIHE